MNESQVTDMYLSIVNGLNPEKRADILLEHNDAISAFSYVAVSSMTGAVTAMGQAAIPMLSSSLKAHSSLLFLLGFEAGVEYGKLERIMPDLDASDEGGE